MKTLQRFSKQLQERTSKMNREALLALFIIFGSLGSGACFLVVYRSLAHPPPLHKILPLHKDSIIQNKPK